MRALSRLSLIAAVATVLASAASATPPVVLLDLPESVPAQAEFKPGDLGFTSEVDEPIVCPPHAPQQTSARTLGELLRGTRRDIPDGDAKGYTPPQPLQVPPAEYPASDWVMGIEGHVRLALLIDAAGRVLATETICATNERFELEALKRYPQRNTGRPCAMAAGSPVSRSSRSISIWTSAGTDCARKACTRSTPAVACRSAAKALDLTDALPLLPTRRHPRHRFARQR